MSRARPTTPKSREQVLPRALLRPVERRALRVGVDQRDVFAVQRPFAGEVQGERRLADAALLIEQSDDHRFPPGLRPKGNDDCFSDCWRPARRRWFACPQIAQADNKS